MQPVVTFCNTTPSSPSYEPTKLKTLGNNNINNNNNNNNNMNNNFYNSNNNNSNN